MRNVDIESSSLVSQLVESLKSRKFDILGYMEERDRRLNHQSFNNGILLPLFKGWKVFFCKKNKQEEQEI